MPEIEPPKNIDLEGLDLLALDAERARLLGDRTTFDELSEEEIERYIAINARMRLTGRTASKPAANGGTKSKRGPERSLEDILSSI